MASEDGGVQTGGDIDQAKAVTLGVKRGSPESGLLL